MTKLPFLVTSLILSVLLISCSGDNLYEFEDLSQKRDMVIQVVVIPEDPNKDFDFQTIFFQTNGYGELVKKTPTYSSSGKYEVVRSAVKEYKKAGVTIIPNKNVSRVEIRIYDLLFDYDVWYSAFENVEGKITLSYDFERDREEVIRE